MLQVRFLLLGPWKQMKKEIIRFAPGNDEIWGEGNWIRCSICPHDYYDREVYHHKDAHAGVTQR